jgi:hypothetical protein
LISTSTPSSNSVALPSLCGPLQLLPPAARCRRFRFRALRSRAAVHKCWPCMYGKIQWACLRPQTCNDLCMAGITSKLRALPVCRGFTREAANDRIFKVKLDACGAVARTVTR